MASPSELILVHRAADNTEIARFYAPKCAEVVLQQLFVVGQLKTEDGVVLADGDVLEAGTYKFYDVPAPAAAAPGVSQIGSLAEGSLFVNVQLERGATLCNASLLVDTGCDWDLNLSEFKANQLGLAPDGVAADVEMGQGLTGQITRRGPVLTTLLLEGEGEEVAKDPRRSDYLTVWADTGTGGDSGSGRSSTSAASSTPSSSRPSSSDEAAESSMLKIKVLSPIMKGKDSRGYDAILGASGMAKLNLGIDKDTMRLYKKQARPFRKVVKQQQ